MLRRLLALAGALAVASAGVTPCAAAAIARGPAGADPHAAHHASATAAEGARSHVEPGAECHEPGASLVPHCDCGCTGDRPHGVSGSAPPTFDVSAEPAPETGGTLRAELVAAPAPRAEAPRPRIDHVPIAS